MLFSSVFIVYLCSQTTKYMANINKIYQKASQRTVKRPLVCVVCLSGGYFKRFIRPIFYFFAVLSFYAHNSFSVFLQRHVFSFSDVKSMPFFLKKRIDNYAV